MNIGLFGYGKMGKAIEALAAEHQATIIWKINRDNRHLASPEFIRQADVVIEFTRPETAYENVLRCLQAGVPVVSGTTGWQDQLAQAEDWCQQQQGAFLWASNFSVGVNLLFAVNQYLAKLMNDRPEYQPQLSETHHIHKLDAPSGTALSLTKDILALVDRKTSWKLQPEPAGPQDIPVTAFREDEVPGTHTVCWSSAIDEITLEHRAHSRAGFAAGALLAAQWIFGKKGVFRMSDVLGL